MDILEDVIAVNGDCLQATRCSRCPFASECLPKFAEESGPWTKEERRNRAMNALAHQVLMGDNYEPS
jgi:hypothetical protein